MSYIESTTVASVESSPVAVVKLYDTVLGHIKRAAAAAREANYQKQFDEVMCATRILNGLSRHLNMEQGGQVAINLRDMYESVNRVLLRSVGKSTAAEACDKLIEALRNTRNAWAEVCGMPVSPAD